MIWELGADLDNFRQAGYVHYWAGEDVDACRDLVLRR